MYVQTDSGGGGGGEDEERGGGERDRERRFITDAAAGVRTREIGELFFAIIERYCEGSQY